MESERRSVYVTGGYERSWRELLASANVFEIVGEMRRALRLRRTCVLTSGERAVHPREMGHLSLLEAERTGEIAVMRIVESPVCVSVAENGSGTYGGHAPLHDGEACDKRHANHDDCCATATASVVFAGRTGGCGLDVHDYGPAEMSAWGNENDHADAVGGLCCLHAPLKSFRPPPYESRLRPRPREPSHGASCPVPVPNRYHRPHSRGHPSSPSSSPSASLSGRRRVSGSRTP